MTTLDRLRSLRTDILCIAERHGASKVRIFGSVLRGDDGPDSDVDFLIDAKPATTPWFPGGLIADLEDLIGRRVDVVTERAVDPLVKEWVLAEAVAL